MKKSILNIGNALDKAEQKSINGGMMPPPPPGLIDCSLLKKQELCETYNYCFWDNTIIGSGLCTSTH